MMHNKTAQLPLASPALAELSKQHSRWQTLPDFPQETGIKTFELSDIHSSFESLTSLKLTFSRLG